MPLSEAQFNSAVKHDSRILFGYLCHACNGRAEEAADILQRTFKRAWEKRESFRDGDNVRAWFFGIARGEWRIVHRSQTRQTALKAICRTRELDWVTTTVPAECVNVEQLEACLSELSPGEQELVKWLFGKEDPTGAPQPRPLSYREISERYAYRGRRCSEGALRARYSRSLTQLRRCMGIAQPAIPDHSPHVEGELPDGSR